MVLENLYLFALWWNMLIMRGSRSISDVQVSNLDIGLLFDAIRIIRMLVGETWRRGSRDPLMNGCHTGWHRGTLPWQPVWHRGVHNLLKSLILLIQPNQALQYHLSTGYHLCLCKDIIPNQRALWKDIIIWAFDDDPDSQRRSRFVHVARALLQQKQWKNFSPWRTLHFVYWADR